MVEIQSQHAEKIYNVNGNLYLQDSSEVQEFLRIEKQKELAERNSLDYFRMLVSDFDAKKLITRESLVEDINRFLEESGQVILYGEPGIGKSTLAYQISNTTDKVIYISLKNKSSLSVLLYLINKVRGINNDSLLEITNLEEALEWMQVCLLEIQSKIHFIIDDCDQSKELAEKLMCFEKGQNSFLFLVRNNKLFEHLPITSYACNSFTKDEIRQYLLSHDIFIGELDLNNLISSSQGNPLYLFYYSHFNRDSIPPDLQAFQNEIWNNLSEIQQEKLIFIAISYSYVNIKELIQISGRTPIQVAKDLQEIHQLVKNNDGHLEIFHPSLEEFIHEKLEKNGILSVYQKQLGEYYLSEKKIIHATYLLRKNQPEKIEKYAFAVVPYLVESGDLLFALELLEIKKEYAESSFEEGYLYYCFFHIHHLLGNKNESTQFVDKALDLLNHENHELYVSALTFKAINYVEIGCISEALKIVDRIFDDLDTYSKEIKPLVLSNISKIYTDLSEFRKGAETAKKAYELFVELGEQQGIIMSCSNFVSCLSQIKGKLDLAEEYGLKLLEYLDKSPNVLLVRTVILSTLAHIYREKEDFDKARMFSEQAIAFCQKYGLSDKVVLNLINYGNIIRDSGDKEKAINIYEEALSKALEANLLKEVGRIYWILSAEKRLEGDYALSLEFSDKSYKKCQESEFRYGMAKALEHKAETLLLLGRSKDSAESFIMSATHYAEIDMFAHAYQKMISEAIKIYHTENDQVKVKDLINNQLIFCERINLDVSYCMEIIISYAEEVSIREYTVNLFTRYLSQEGISEQNAVNAISQLVNYCNRVESKAGKEFFLEIVQLMINKVGGIKYSYSLLGIIIEQSRELLGQDELDIIYEELSQKLSFFSYRTIDEAVILTTVISEKINLQITVYEDELICQKLAIALILFINEISDFITTKLIFSNISCPIQFFLYSPQLQEYYKEQIPILYIALSFEKVSSIHMEKKEIGTPNIILINNQYEFEKNMEGKEFLYLIHQSIYGLRKHFCLENVEITDDENLKSLLLNYLADFFGFISPNVKDEKYDIRISLP
ncbi:tetratricopeptide repeat protein [Wohlfahrtiimonas chitiniclastica]|uniref:tetratricopeptide repeat protein n=1 Tax=Wohlfahrtiimonas chitiniclastica TaxID=400946 RepID=UPI001BCA821A|nr:tetratricopeptide repeat protein [Wohlfahrtiimonas chitiniclastica]